MWDEDTGEFLSDASPGVQLAHMPHATSGLASAPEDGGLMGRLVATAQALERDPAKLIARAKQIGGLLGSAGFYRFPAGGSTVEGPSIDMAQALAQEWGAIVYQVRIVQTESLASGGQRVHLRASVADMRSLVCAEVDQVVSTAPPPGKFAEKADQRERWHGMQIQSAASKIVRNAILRVLPAWYVDPAFDSATAVDGKRALNGKTLPEARKAAADVLKEFGASTEELEAFLGQPFDMWAVPQISSLRQLYSALKSGAQSVEAWRAGLAAKGEPTAARKTALGLPASNGANPLDAVVAAAAKAKAAPVATKTKAGKQESTEPAHQPMAGGDGEPPADVKATLIAAVDAVPGDG